MNGVIPLHKEIGLTSSDCVYKLRKILHTKKVGHTGTLDPLVDGVLPICVGQSTKLVNRLTGSPKEYEGEITLGMSTTTEDREGDVVEEVKLNQPFEIPKLEETFKSMIGDLTQIPPMYSAVKVNGKKLYEYARAGLKVERPERKIHLYDFYLMGDPVFDSTSGKQTVRFHVRCSKGTYVRTLAVEFGSILGVPSYMSKLTRTQSAGFDLKDTFTLSDIESMIESNEYGFFKSIDDVLVDLPVHELTDEEWEINVQHGGFLEFSQYDTNKNLRVTKNNITKAIYKYDPKDSMWKPETMLLNNE
ncbi:tRNA pseudouridine(55) synthase TruB [Companilactobacillus baiquanensis]|uniref:tRNA pseudouridine synthase B n=1 Tax=Companilactobacillus baiquanensis TaxID=2486005 RepID=A0ABW1URJ0_9LACO|nr:tRNA pseudouridine(55) synthase TruB [Companilactobacillus baiquanensis]